jgi:Immunity protein 10
MLTFTARAVAAEELRDINTFVVVLAENHDGSGARLELQKALRLDERDRKLEMDTYCLCTQEGATFYGGIESWKLMSDLLEINLNTRATEVLGVLGFAISFSAKDFAMLENGLAKVLS